MHDITTKLITTSLPSQLHFQATKKLIKLADFEDDDLEMMDDSDDAASDDASDFDEDLDPDKIEVPGETNCFSFPFTSLIHLFITTKIIPFSLPKRRRQRSRNGSVLHRHCNNIRRDSDKSAKDRHQLAVPQQVHQNRNAFDGVVIDKANCHQRHRQPQHQRWQTNSLHSAKGEHSQQPSPIEHKYIFRWDSSAMIVDVHVRCDPICLHFLFLSLSFPPISFAFCLVQPRFSAWALEAEHSFRVV